MDKYNAMILMACEAYVKSEHVHSEDLIVFIETIFNMKDYENEKMGT